DRVPSQGYRVPRRRLPERSAPVEVSVLLRSVSFCFCFGVACVWSQSVRTKYLQRSTRGWQPLPPRPRKVEASLPSAKDGGGSRIEPCSQPSRRKCRRN